MACSRRGEPKLERCPRCGGEAFAELTVDRHVMRVLSQPQAQRGDSLAELSIIGDVLVLPATTRPCQHCLQSGRELKLRYYRRVTALLVEFHTHDYEGYFCRTCRRRLFTKHMTLTLLLGWWGLFAVAANLYAIFVNLWALLGVPYYSHRAITAVELTGEAFDDPARAHLYPNRDEISAVLARTRQRDDHPRTQATGS